MTQITITPEARERLWGFIEAVDTEIGGFGYAWINGDEITWDTVFLVPQYASHSEVDFEDLGGDVAAIERAATDGVLDDPLFVWVSWHSHHSMQPFWSKTDDDRIKGFTAAGVSHLLSFVGCHDHKYKLRLDSFGVEHSGLIIGQVTSNDLTLIGAEPLTDPGILAEIAANVKKQPVKQGRPPLAQYSKPDTSFTIKDAMKEWSVDEADARDIIAQLGGSYVIGVGGTVSQVGDGFDALMWEGSD